MRQFYKLIIVMLVLLSLAQCSSATQPNFAGIHDFDARKQAFIHYLLPHAREANESIAKQREYLVNLYQQWQQEHFLKAADQVWLTQLAEQYKLKSFSPEQKADWQTLLKRVDVVPVSMLLAQSANESSWGRSRFARQGKNYFGQWCFDPGCGIVPAQRAKGAKYEVRRFPTVKASIKSYIRNLNTNNNYQSFRDLRYQLRQQDKALQGLVLAQGLKYYSIRREAYVRSIRSIIQKNHLTRYDLA